MTITITSESAYFSPQTTRNEGTGSSNDAYVSPTPRVTGATGDATITAG